MLVTRTLWLLMTSWTRGTGCRSSTRLSSRDTMRPTMHQRSTLGSRVVRRLAELTAAVAAMTSMHHSAVSAVARHSRHHSLWTLCQLCQVFAASLCQTVQQLLYAMLMLTVVSSADGFDTAEQQRVVAISVSVDFLFMFALTTCWCPTVGILLHVMIVMCLIPSILRDWL